jgi:hypothetical protein
MFAPITNSQEHKLWISTAKQKVICVKQETQILWIRRTCQRGVYDSNPEPNPIEKKTVNQTMRQEQQKLPQKRYRVELEESDKREDAMDSKWPCGVLSPVRLGPVHGPDFYAAHNPAFLTDEIASSRQGRPSHNSKVSNCGQTLNSTIGSLGFTNSQENHP